MAEERRAGRPDPRQEEAVNASAVEKKPKVKAKKSRFSLFLLLLLLAAGIGVGLHFSGLWDGRPLFWGTVPKIPYVGPSLARFFNVPEQYTLTVQERRRRELEAWQKRLDENHASVALDQRGDQSGRADAVFDHGHHAEQCVDV